MDGGLKALLKESAAVALGGGSGGTEKVSPSFRLQRIQTADRTADPAGEALDCANMLGLHLPVRTCAAGRWPGWRGW